MIHIDTKVSDAYLKTLTEDSDWDNTPQQLMARELIHYRTTILHNTGTTHYEGCYLNGPKHYDCALQVIKQLQTALCEANIGVQPNV